MPDDLDKKTINELYKLLENISIGKYAQFPINDNISVELKDLAEKINEISMLLKELEEYSVTLSKGDLNVTPPNRKNFLAAGVKTLHAQLNHIAWQAKQVTSGDYDQVIDFMGEFSHAFNTMTTMFKQREHISRERQKLLMDIFNNLNMIIAVLDNQNKSILFLNEMAIKYGQEYNHEGDLLSSMIIKNLPDFGNTGFFYENHNGRWYQIECMPIDWQNEKNAILCTMLDITQMKQTEQTLRDAAEKDTMTGVYRRDAGISVFNDSIKENSVYTVCFLDIDDLKVINDNYGHAAGDIAIRSIAEILKQSLRDTDIIIRLGGDEFLFILMGCGNKKAEEINKRIFESLKKYNLESEHPFEISVSIGMSKATKNIEELERLINDADSKMYQMKQKRKSVPTLIKL